MANLVILGAQWGDEGKGKIVDLLSEKADVVVRYQGGHNAGHTVKVGDDETILHLIPSGILHEGKMCVIGQGVVVDPKALLDEIEKLEKKGIKVAGRLLISERANLIMPYHRVIDKSNESHRGEKKIGTTGRGIGPAYSDKMARIGIRFVDLLETELFAERLADNLQNYNYILEKLYHHPDLKFAQVFAEYEEYGQRLKPYIADTSLYLANAMARGEKILFEGAQGTLLDVDSGTYPYVTSSSCCSGGSLTGTGVGPQAINHVVGVMKAYTTRVGEGPFPTELLDADGEKLREIGHEYGATTGRPRRCGWFDSVVGRYAVRTNGLTGLAVTKLDVLDAFDTIKICTGYKIDGEVVQEFPASLSKLRRIEPVFEEMPGWKTSTVGAKGEQDLPPNAVAYLRRIEELVGCKAVLVSTGPKRDQTYFTPDFDTLL
ncbi:adenylosuccinate synthase [Desulfurispirillum indicum]|uniref:Adenylosuccinate synthetase n=1 Tax=Desulfurispirillum indicum (strain ATCC BAA-1389 / DSM 22839 / S5) TaxID=653733 RepID=E6W5Z5_DESIS|nr:adenylosuccinate synthase [Desulfurispirillum indicum]ADU64934.1 adenylosuccinate synthetase [Desulfurispirillum indicum S5]UCZ56870.1 adenylosuccinate synthase [Desulfurispirillum indicum]